MVTDFEAASWNAIRDLIPNIEVKGCLFHFAQAVYRKVKKLHLTNAYLYEIGTRQLCKHLMALPMLPEQHIVDAFHRITKYVVDDETGGLKQLKDLVEYMRSTWIESTQFPPSSWCWYRQAIRTNNDVEGWHTRLITSAEKGKLPFYKLISLLGKESKIVDLDCRLVKYEQLNRRQRKSSVEMHKKMMGWWDVYADNRMHYSKLLEKASRLMEPSKTWDVVQDE